MHHALMDDHIAIGNKVRDVRDTVMALRIALQGDATGFSREMVDALHHVCGWAEQQAGEAVNLSDRAVARLEGKRDA